MQQYRNKETGEIVTAVVKFLSGKVDITTDKEGFKHFKEQWIESQEDFNNKYEEVKQC